MPHQPLFVYLQQHDWQVGSALKYFDLLKAHYGGLDLTSGHKGPAVGADFLKSLKTVKPDLAFCRGDWLKYWMVLVKKKIPYILIEQDVHSLRTKVGNRQIKDERTMLESAAGVIFTSADHRDYLCERYRITNHAVVHLRPLRKHLAWHPMEKLPGDKHLVYAGGLVKMAPGGSYGYRAYGDIFKAFIDAGWTVHTYGSRNQYATVRDYAKKIGTIPHGWREYPVLLQEMSQYTAGLQAYCREGVKPRAFAYTQTCRPNKTWDYLAAGIPTIGLYAGNCAKIYQEGGWGIVIPDTERSTLENIELPTFPPDERFKQVMDDDIVLFDEVIQKALSRGKERIEIHSEGDEEVIDLNKAWYVCKKVVIQDGVILHGKGKRIPRKEAIRLGLVKKEEEVKKAIKNKRAKKAKKEEKKKTPKKVVKEEKVEVVKEPEPEKKEEVQKLHNVLVKKEVVEDKEKEVDN
jgi:hypothetical protein